jgi:integrase
MRHLASGCGFGEGQGQGIVKIHLHQTRHTFARMVAKRSGSLSETQDALGHRHASTTRIYDESIVVKTDK